MGETFLFGSEIKSFLCHPHFKKVLNTAALENYLTFQYSPCDETFFQGVYKLPPAHYFTYQDGKFTMKRYWDVHFKADQKPDLDTWVNRISDTFHDSVEAHKIADVEVGSFLSSGVDSSYVAAIANVDKTFTVGFGTEERYNEIGWAKGFSEAIGKKNYNKVITPEEYWEKLPMIQYHMDEPLADPAAIALYFVCNLASQSLKSCSPARVPTRSSAATTSTANRAGLPMISCPADCVAASDTSQRKCRHTAAETSLSARARIWKNALSATPICSHRRNARHC